MNDLDNNTLLLRSHLIIAGKAQPSPENIGSNIHSRAFYIGICPPSSISLDRDERIRPVDRLHMHWLPDRTSLSIEGRDRVQDLLRGALAALAHIEVVLLAAHHRSRGFLIQDAAGEPVVRNVLNNLN